MNDKTPDQTLKNEPWFDKTLYPFTAHYLDLPGGRMHYLDEGSGETLLFVHGTPAWSFLYRVQIEALSRKYRCIAPDHLGFGLSDKPSSFEGTPQAHTQNLAKLIEHLGLETFTLVVHDFGGPIGLSYAIAHPEKIKGIVLFNTWLWETKTNKNVLKVDKLIRSALGRFLYLRLNFSPKVLLKSAFSNRAVLTPRIHKHYIRVFPSKSDRYGLLKIAESLLGSSDWYQQQWSALSTLNAVPKLILWGSRDPFLTPHFLDVWKKRWPGAEVKLFDCGHFVQEEQAAAVTEAIHAFLKDR